MSNRGPDAGQKYIRCMPEAIAAIPAVTTLNWGIALTQGGKKS